MLREVRYKVFQTLYCQKPQGIERLFISGLMKRYPLAMAPGSLPWAIETATWRSFPQIASFVYRELQSTGNLALIQAESLRRNLAGHYTSLQNDAQVGLDQDTQHLFDRKTAGLLTSDELIEVENAGSANHPIVMSPARALEIAEAFSQNKDAVAILPSLAHHHTFIEKVINQAKERTRKLIAQIDELIIQLE